MKTLFLILIFFITQSCSFDNKSGIWNNENVISDKEIDSFNEFKKLSSVNKVFNENIPVKKDFNFELIQILKNQDWSDIFYDSTNNLKNFSFNETNNLTFKSKKLTRNRINNYILYKDQKIVAWDEEGNIIIFSIKKNKILKKFNFYKKKFKKLKKKLNIILQDDTLYVSDNLGYLYALNYKNFNVLWAKNYKIPFRSNIKIIKNKLVAANQNNDLIFFDKKSGEKLNIIPTEETTVKNEFINSVSFYKEILFFLNTYGSLYSINTDIMRINWFINLNQTTDINPSNLFYGSDLVINKDYVVISSNDFTYIINANDGTIINKLNFSFKVKPLIINKYLFLVTKNNYLISWDLKRNKIIYSYNINQKIADFLNIKKKKINVKNIMMINSKLFVFLNNSYILKFSLKGSLEEINKIPSKINTNPIFANDQMLFISHKNKINILN